MNFAGRIKTAVPTLLEWLLFSIGAIAICVLQLLAILAWVVTGSDLLRDWVYRTGKGTDQVNNAGWFAGDHKETISSAVGKRYYLHYKMPADFAAPPPGMRFVRWLTDKFEPAHVFKAIELQPGAVFTPEQKHEAIELADNGLI